MPLEADQITRTPGEVEITKLDPIPRTDPNDKPDAAYETEAGTRLRMRLTRIGDQGSDPLCISMALTVTRLDAEGEVVRDEDGNVIIDRHEIIINAHHMDDPDHDVQAVLDQTLRQASFLIERRAGKRELARDIIDRFDL